MDNEKLPVKLSENCFRIITRIASNIVRKYNQNEMHKKNKVQKYCQKKNCEIYCKKNCQKILSEKYLRVIIRIVSNFVKLIDR